MLFLIVCPSFKKPKYQNVLLERNGAHHTHTHTPVFFLKMEKGSFILFKKKTKGNFVDQKLLWQKKKIQVVKPPPFPVRKRLGPNGFSKGPICPFINKT